MPGPTDESADIDKLAFRQALLRETRRGIPDSVVWVNNTPFELDDSHDLCARRDVNLPSLAFELLDLLTAEECARLISVGNRLGFDRKVTKYGLHQRRNGLVEWLFDNAFCDELWRRMRPVVVESLLDLQPVGVNNLMRIYRYDPGDEFLVHTDHSSPNREVVDGSIRAVGGPDERSLLSVLIYLNEDFDGGSTRLVAHPRSEDVMRMIKKDNNTVVEITPVTGNAICFRQGRDNSPMRHVGVKVTRGHKYILKTDIRYG